MQTNADQSRLTLRTGSATLPVLALSGTESLSQGFNLRVEVLADNTFEAHEHLNSHCDLTLTGPDGTSRRIAGMITRIVEKGHHDATRRRINLTMAPFIAKLKKRIDTRVILGHTAEDIVRDTLQRHCIGRDQVRFHLNRTYQIRPYTLQANETDWDFVHRVLARTGIFGWIGHEAESQIYHFSDHNSFLPHYAHGTVRYIPLSGQEKTATAKERPCGLFKLSECARMTTHTYMVQAYSDQDPAQKPEVRAYTRTDVPPVIRPTVRSYCDGARYLQDADTQARLRAEQAACRAWSIKAEGDLVALMPGHLISLDASRFSDHLTGNYLVTAIEHHASQKAGPGVAGEDISYHNTVNLIRKETPYRTPDPETRPELPDYFTARIESNGPYARLDDQGRYRLRMLFDLNLSSDHGEAGPPLRRLAPYAGPPGEKRTGWHTPLTDGAEVLLSCLNNDPDQPMVVGTLPNPATSSPVTSKNYFQNILRTAGDNELCLDDRKQQESITLRTYGGHNILQLNATVHDHLIRLASKQGAMQLKAH